VDIQFNGTLITSSTNTYPYRAILETLLSYGEDAKKTQLTSALYYKDAAGQMDTLALASGGQTGEWALVQEEQMGPLLTPGKISLNINRDNKH